MSCIAYIFGSILVGALGPPTRGGAEHGEVDIPAMSKIGSVLVGALGALTRGGTEHG